MSTISILVLGAGKLGTAILQSLVKRAPTDTSITVLLRPSAINSTDPQKQRDIAQLRDLGIDIVSGDVVSTSVADLSSVFAPFHTIIGCIGYTTGRGIPLKLAHAILSAGVKRYFPWEFGVDYDIIGKGSAQDLHDEQLEVRDLLRAQEKTEWVIMSTGMFTRYLFVPWFGIVDVEGGVVRALGSWNTSVTVTTPGDIGLMTAEVVFGQPKITNAVIFTAGDTVTYARLADIVDQVLGKKLEREEWSVQKLQQELDEDPTDSIKKFRVVFAQGKGMSWDIETTLNHQRGIKLMGVEEFARQMKLRNGNV